jgi:hypothetical protein
MESKGLNIYFFIALTVYSNPRQINFLGEKWMGCGRLYVKKKVLVCRIGVDDGIEKLL